MIKWSRILTLMGLFLFAAGFLPGIHHQAGSGKEIAETPIKAEFIWSVGSDKENENFYKPQSFAVDKDGRVFVLDIQDGRILCFSKDGKFLFSFGKIGQGPGEFSIWAKKIRVLENQNVCLLGEYNLNVYDKNGNFIRLLKVDDQYWDVDLIDGKYYFPTCYMEEKAKTVHVFDSDGKKERSFGIFIEPEEGFFDRINREKQKNILNVFLNNLPRITKINNREFLYSFYVPYRLVKYNINGEVIKDIKGEVDYGKSQIFSIIHENSFPAVMSNMPLPYIFSPIVKDDGTILVPFLKKERDYLYIDHFDDQLKLIRRYKIQERLAEEGNLLKNVFIDKKNNLYCLITPDTSDDFPRVVKYRLVM